MEYPVRSRLITSYIFHQFYHFYKANLAPGSSTFLYILLPPRLQSE